MVQENTFESLCQYAFRDENGGMTFNSIQDLSFDGPYLVTQDPRPNIYWLYVTNTLNQQKKVICFERTERGIQPLWIGKVLPQDEMD